MVTGSFAFEKGNELKVTIPTVTVSGSTILYDVLENNITVTKSLAFSQTPGNEISNLPSSTSSDNKIIGYAITRNSTILFTTDSAGFDCIWEIDNASYGITLLYLNNLGFSTSRPIQTIFNYENEDIQKVYWIDGTEQIRAINIKHNQIEGNAPLIDTPSNTLNFVANVDFTQPVVTSISSGGNHTAGVIQYAYNLYRLNSSQSKMSPLSELVSLTKGASQGGGDVNEVVGAIPIVEIDDIDSGYTHIKVYAIKYTSFNEVPSVSLIEERELGNETSITIFDDGTVIADLSLAELIFLGSNPIIPKHIESKDNILFPVNLKEKFFDVDLDTRAFSFPLSSSSTIVNNNVYSENEVPRGTELAIDSNFTIDPTHDAVNLKFDTYKYKINSSSLGGSGQYVEYQIVQKSLTNPEDYKLLKDNEIYRIGIQFYNKLGQISPAKWVADFKAPSGNLSGSYNTLKVDLTAAFDTWLSTYSFDSEDDRPVGYKILRAERDLTDRTIMDQGILSPMLFQVKGTEARNKTQWRYDNIKEQYQDDQLKIPSYLTRTFDTFPTSYSNENGVLLETEHLKWLSGNITDNQDGGEVYCHTIQNTLSQTFQHTKMMQFYSPDVLFDVQTTIPAGLKLRVKGGEDNTANGVYAKELWIDTKLERYGGKTNEGLNPHHVASSLYEEDNTFTALLSASGVSKDAGHGFIGPNGNDENTTMDFQQYNREFSTFTANSILFEFDIYGAPEVVERGAGSTLYANNPKYRYSNSLQSFVSGGNNELEGIESINSYGEKCAVLVLGEAVTETSSRTGVEDLYNASSALPATGVLLVELVRDKNYAYLGGIYGGNSYEDKKRTLYIEIGEYKDLLSSANTIQIDSPGDTFVQEFKFLRINKTDTEIYSHKQLQITEVVSFITETTIDLKNRHDISLSNWDAQFQPRSDQFHLYNRVYSQEPSLVRNNAFDFTFRRIKNYDARIIATKTKVPNETVDSWTDILPNTSKDLDGKYGPINSVVNFRDELYTFQDNAFAQIGINPRVQVQGDDDIAIELGTGATLYDYKYYSTNSGSINKWGVLNTQNAIYYVDGLNKGLMRFDGKALTGLSDMKGFHKYFADNLDVPNLRLDNPLLSTGVSMGYDQINNDVYLTYNNNWTICYNELLDTFTSFYSYNSPIYIYNKEKLLTININDSETLYETHAGDYNMYYGTNEQSDIIFLCNPEVDAECTFNNLEYKSEAYNATEVEQRYTWEQIRAYNEFQDTNYKTLDVTNLRKLNRKYRIAIPRNANSTDRIRNNWTFVELVSTNPNSYKYINHDIILYYIPNYIAIQ